MKQSRTAFISNRSYFKHWLGPWRRGPVFWTRSYEDIRGAQWTHLGPVLPRGKHK